jgi:hypothetical protein
VAVVLAGCQHSAPAATPAKLLPGSSQAACLKQIQSIIEKDMGEPVMLTEAAFAQSDLLSISPAPILDPQGRLAQGRIRGMPESYRLSKNQRGCYMLREKMKQSILLDACACEALISR